MVLPRAMSCPLKHSPGHFSEYADGMNVDYILDTFNRYQVAYLLIGGMNFLLRHEPVITFDVDLWIEDTSENRLRCEQALAALDAEWGRSDEDWSPVATKPSGWLASQGVFSLHTPHGPIDIFRSVQGLTDWQTSFANALWERTGGGVDYRGISDNDMLLCQQVLELQYQKPARIQTLQSKLKNSP